MAGFVRMIFKLFVCAVILIVTFVLNQGRPQLAHADTDTLFNIFGRNEVEIAEKQNIAPAEDGIYGNKNPKVSEFVLYNNIAIDEDIEGEIQLQNSKGKLIFQDKNFPQQSHFEDQAIFPDTNVNLNELAQSLTLFDSAPSKKKLNIRRFQDSKKKKSIFKFIMFRISNTRTVEFNGCCYGECRTFFNVVR